MVAAANEDRRAYDLAVTGLRMLAVEQGHVISASVWGKLKTTIQFVAILLAILRPGGPLGGEYLDEWVMLVAAFITVMSAVDYLQRFAPALTARD